MENKHITISDIAAAAGVSKTTVSRYLNGKFELMSEKTRERIESVVSMSGYRPSDVARCLKRRSSGYVGVVVADIASPFSSAIILAIGDVLTSSGYTPLFVNSSNSPSSEAALISSLLSKAVDGLIVNGSDVENPLLISLACSGFPVVLCDREINDYSFELVTSDYGRIIRKLVQHLKSEGFSTVSFFNQSGWERVSPRAARRKAYLEAMRDIFGISDAESLIYCIDPHDEGSALQALKSLMSSVTAGSVPAIIGVNSVTTFHTLTAVKRMNLCMPYQLGLCGSDDWDWSGQMSWPEITVPDITTYTIKAYETGAECARLIVDRIADPSAPKRKIILPCELTPRGSTALAAAQEQPNRIDNTK